VILEKTQLHSIALAIGMVFFASTAMALPEADHARGVQAAQRADYVSALPHFQVLAAQGDPAAQYNLAMLYAHGLGVPRNATLANLWAKKSAAAGYALAIDWLAKSEQGIR